MSSSIETRSGSTERTPPQTTKGVDGSFASTLRLCHQLSKFVPDGVQDQAKTDARFGSPGSKCVEIVRNNDSAYEGDSQQLLVAICRKGRVASLDCAISTTLFPHLSRHAVQGS